MKKIILSAMLLVSCIAQAQNIQLHYDFGKHIYNEESERQPVTATFEQFKADGLGSWFYFIDLDFDKKGMLGGYAEVSREFTFAKLGESSSFAAHIEYDGGLNRYGSFQQAALVGAAWNGHSADYSKTYSVQAMYKQYFGQDGMKAYSSFQLTGVWGLNFANDKLTFSGFIDFWRGKKANGHGQLVILTEPQLWYNFNKHISVGTEVELSNNFIYNTVNNKTFFVNPTVAMKFNF